MPKEFKPAYDKEELNAGIAKMLASMDKDAPSEEISRTVKTWKFSVAPKKHDVEVQISKGTVSGLMVTCTTPKCTNRYNILLAVNLRRMSATEVRHQPFCMECRKSTERRRSLGG